MSDLDNFWQPCESHLKSKQKKMLYWLFSKNLLPVNPRGCGGRVKVSLLVWGLREVLRLTKNLDFVCNHLSWKLPLQVFFRNLAEKSWTLINYNFLGAEIMESTFFSTFSMQKSLILLQIWMTIWGFFWGWRFCNSKIGNFRIFNYFFFSFWPGSLLKPPNYEPQWPQWLTF